MSDNVTSPVPVGTVLASDDVGGVQYPRTKLAYGVDGAATDVSASSPLPVQNPVGQKTMASSLSVVFASDAPALSLGLANGADATTGNTADAAYSGSGAGTVISILKGIYAAPTPAGTNNIGSVNLGTIGGAATAANQATMIANAPALATSGSAAPTTGTLLMGSDGTNSRPLLTATNGTLNVRVGGDVAAGTADSGNPTKIGGYASATAPTAVIAGQRVNSWHSLYGALVVTLADAGGGTSLYRSPNGDGNSAFSGLITYSQNLVYSSAGWARAAGDANGSYVVSKPDAVASTGIAPATVANATSQVAKASVGNLYALNVNNAAVDGTYVIVYNAAAAPSAGATLTAGLILWSYKLPNGGSLDKAWQVPINCTAGSVVLYSTSLTTFTAPATAPLTSTVMVK